MANQYSGPPWENNDVDFVPDFYLPQNQYYPTSSPRSGNWQQLIQYARSLNVSTRYAVKLTVFVLVVLFGLKVSVPAVAEAPAFDQLSNAIDINQILVPLAEVREAASVASIGSANINSNGTFHNPESEDITFYQSPTEEGTSEGGVPEESISEESISEESASEVTEESIASDSTPTESEVEQSTPSNSESDDALIYEGSTGCCIWPTRGRISSRVTRWHTAIDIAAPYWSPVVAADGGRVIAAGWDRTGYGYRMIIHHGDGISTLYAHLARYYYNYGDYVNKGMMIGRVGSTGNSSGNHLHFEVRVNNYRQNPWNWLP